MPLTTIAGVGKWLKVRSLKCLQVAHNPLMTKRKGPLAIRMPLQLKLVILLKIEQLEDSEDASDNYSAIMI